MILYTVKQLKIISNELSIRNARFRDSMMFSPPKSGAKKAEWVCPIELNVPSGFIQHDRQSVSTDVNSYIIILRCLPLGRSSMYMPQTKYFSIC